MAEEKNNPWNRSHLWVDELARLMEIIYTTGLTETVKWGTPVFTYNGKNILGVIGLKNYFALWFYKGVFLKDEAKVLVSAKGEETKSLRQWRFKSKEEINEKLLLQYIYEAIEIEKAGLAIKPEKKEVIIPDLLQEELDKSVQLSEAFFKFTPYKQKDFCEFIETAKQEKTKLSRLEKIRPMILDGIGLNDKYSAKTK